MVNLQALLIAEFSFPILCIKFADKLQLFKFSENLYCYREKAYFFLFKDIKDYANKKRKRE